VYESLFYILYVISYRPNLSVCILCYVTDLHADRDSVCFVGVDYLYFQVNVLVAIYFEF